MGFGSALWSVLVNNVWGGIVARHFKRASMGDIPEGCCVACESKDIRWIGLNAYECNTCGHTGGSGLKAMQDGHRLDFVLEMSLERRREWSRENLENARLLLLSCADTIASAKEYIGPHIIGFENDDVDEVSENLQEITNALGEYTEAMQLIRDAEYGLYLADEKIAAEERTVDYSTWAEDVMHDFNLKDLSMHAEIKKIDEMVKYATEHIDRRLADFA